MNKMFIGIKMFISVLALVFASSANANLVINGDFEMDPTGPAEFSWTVSNLYNEAHVPGWVADPNDYIELWTEQTNEGTNTFAELNADWASNENKSWALSQVVQLEKDAKYNFSFDYRARQLDDEVFRFKVEEGEAGVNIVNKRRKNHDTLNEWYSYSGMFTATTEMNTLLFNAANKGDTYGNFIDNVSLTMAVDTSSIPEPGALFLFGLALVGLGLHRKNAQ